MPLPDPALVVLVGPSGSGKSTWAAARYRGAEVVSSDTLRGVVGSGPHDLDASDEAFALLETIVAARLGRGLSTVVDTLGTDADRRLGWRERAWAVGCRPSRSSSTHRTRPAAPATPRATSRCRPWTRVERLRGRTPAAAYAERTHAGTGAQQRDRYGALADAGVDTVFVALADLETADDLERLAALLT